jgi:hypothetical protein
MLRYTEESREEAVHTPSASLTSPKLISPALHITLKMYFVFLLIITLHAHVFASPRLPLHISILFLSHMTKIDKPLHLITTTKILFVFPVSPHRTNFEILMHQI